MRKLIASAVLFCLATVPAFSADAVIEKIAARVNDQIITRTEYERSRETLKQESQQATNPDKAFAEREKDVLRDLIDRQLLLEKGKDLGITAETEVIKRLDEMRKQMKMDSMEDLEKAATAQGVAFEDFKQQMKEQIITQQVIGKEVGSHMQLSKDDEQKFYDEHKEDLRQPEQIRLSEILVATPAVKEGEAGDPQVVAAAKAKAEGLLADLHKGAKFEDIAKKNSNGPTAAQGGDLGFFKRGVLDKTLEDKTFAMKAGDFSEVTQTKQGFVILAVTEHQQEGIPELKDIEPKVQDAMYMQKLQPALRVYLAKLRTEAYIDVKEGYIDTGASSDETKPVETQAKVKAAKELKKKKKFLLF
ncbi:MAG TPA: peptidylprolyl isomerase [Terriglobales bacterium]|jgi:peptidyl-prolyl cis-trans isomerase SurA|nr:peptidylprolyl isomerase [Terriglobales bacterium]